MEQETKKFNPYIIIIVVLLIIIGGFAYNQWGKGFLPTLVKNSENPEAPASNSSNVDTAAKESDIQIGNKDATVTVVEYYSYFCSYCKRFHEETYPKIIEQYVGTGKVKFVFRVFPPPELGLAVLCVKEQDKFLEYHEKLFESSAEIKEPNDLKIIAEKINGLDKTKFNECYDSGKYIDQVEKWVNQGNKDFETAGVPEEQRGTPAFFINGELLLGALPYESFVEVIERKLGE